MIAILIASIIGICLLLHEIRPVRTSESPLLAISAIIIYIYVFALIGLLNAGVYSLVSLGVIALPFVFIIHRKNLRGYLKGLLQPGFVLFLFFLISLYPVCKPIVTGAWDEYSHWALIVRNMLLTEALPRAGGAIRFISYPPATALVQYLFVKFTNGPEGMMYYGQAVFMAACLCAMLKGQTFKKPVYILLALLLPLLAVIKFSLHNIFNIFTDSIMAICAAACFACYYSSERKFIDIVKLLPIFFTICLIRMNAVIFVIFVILMIMVDQIRSKSDRDKSPGISLLMLLIPVFLSLGSWFLHLKMIGVVGKDSNVFPIDWSHFSTVAHNFAVALCFKSVGTANPLLPKFTTALAMCIMGGVLLLIVHFVIRRQSQLQKDFDRMAITIIICFALYCIGMLGVYEFSFTNVEGEQVAGYGRYIGSYFAFAAACVGYMLSSMLSRGQLAKALKMTVTVLSVLLILAMAGLSHPWQLNIFGSRQLENIYAEESKACAQQIQEAVGGEAKVYMIFQKSRGYTFMGTRYQLGTNTTNLGSWSFGTPYSEEDTWTVDWPPEVLGEVLVNQNYDYVYIGNGDDQLWSGYGDLFDIPGQIVYKVNPALEPLLTAVK